MPSRKRADCIIHDVELHITLPDAYVVIHVDDDNAPWVRGWKGSKVDWAWEEPGMFYLCELKDPECSGAVEHALPAGQPSHIQATIAKLTSTTFPNEFAMNVRDTLENQPHAKTSINTSFIVVAAISDPNFNAAVAGPASATIRRHLARLKINIPVVVLNIDEWNKQLSPRRIERMS
jgi:hypothetical protein